VRRCWCCQRGERHERPPAAAAAAAAQACRAGVCPRQPVKLRLRKRNSKAPTQPNARFKQRLLRASCTCGARCTPRSKRSMAVHSPCSCMSLMPSQHPTPTPTCFMAATCCSAATARLVPWARPARAAAAPLAAWQASRGCHSLSAPCPTCCLLRWRGAAARSTAAALLLVCLNTVVVPRSWSAGGWGLVCTRGAVRRETPGSKAARMRALRSRLALLFVRSKLGVRVRRA
jgi:hypothetical protein